MSVISGGQNNKNKG